VAQQLKLRLERQNELQQTEEQIAQSALEQNNALIDLNRQINDYFQQMGQQIGEAKLELDRMTNELKYGKIRRELQRILVPGSNTFMNGVVQNIQSIFDQASGVMEAVLGQKAAGLSFAGEKYSMQTQMEDFTRSVGGATEAVKAFRDSLMGGSATATTTATTTQPAATTTTPAAQAAKGMPVATTTTTQPAPRATATAGGRVTESYRTNTLPGRQHHGASRDGGGRKHQGVDFDVSGNQQAQSFIGGQVTRVGHQTNAKGETVGYGRYVDIYNAQLKVVERIAEVGTLTAKVGDIIAPGGSVGYGETKTGVFHYEIHIQNINAQRQAGFKNFKDTVDPLKFYEKLGLIKMDGGKVRVIGGMPGGTTATTATQPARTGGVTQSQRQAIDNVLKRYNSPLKVDDVINASLQSGVAVDFILAQAAQESGIGSQGMGRTSRNPLNYGNNSINGNVRPFPSFQEGLNTATRLIARDYATTFEQFKERQMRHQKGIGYYAANNTNSGPDPTYIPRIESLIKQFRGMGVPGIIPQGAATAQATTVSTQPTVNANDPLAGMSQQQMAALLKIKEATLGTGEQLTTENILKIFDDTLSSAQANTRQIVDEGRNIVETWWQAQESFADLARQYSGDTLTAKVQEMTQQAGAQFRGIRNNIFEQKRNVDEVFKIANELIPLWTKRSADLRAAGMGNAADEIDRGLKYLQQQVLPAYEGYRKELEAQEQQLAQLEQQAADYINAKVQELKVTQDLETANAELKNAQAQGDPTRILEATQEVTRLQEALDKIQLPLQLLDDPELLKERIKLAEEAAKLASQQAGYEFESAQAARQIELLQLEIADAEAKGYDFIVKQLKLRKLEVEYFQEKARLQKEITDDAQRELFTNQLNEQYWRDQDQLNNDFINQQIAKGDRLLEQDARIRTEQAGLERNNFRANEIREGLAMEQAEEESRRRKEEYRQANPNDPDAVDRYNKREDEALKLRLQSIDREFLDLQETIGVGVAGAFNSFFTALVNGENALQAFAQSLLSSLMDIGSQLISSGVNSLIGGLFGFSEGGYTGPGGKTKPAGIVHAGEFVLTKEATKRIGLPTLNYMNMLWKLPGYLAGGAVGLEENLLGGLNSIERFQPAIATAGSTTNNASNSNSRNTTIKIEQNFMAPVDRFNASANTLAREQAEALRRAMR
jgi:hypothetical protein